MSLTVTRARVKEKCGIADTTYDSTIDNLIAEVTPAIEFAIRDLHLADVGSANLQATLSLGATEIVCGEFLDQIARSPGASEILTVGAISMAPNDAPARQIKASGWRRLRPFLKPDPSAMAASGVVSAAGKASIEETEA